MKQNFSLNSVPNPKGLVSCKPVYIAETICLVIFIYRSEIYLTFLIDVSVVSELSE
jgi:hypothetical protein